MGSKGLETRQQQQYLQCCDFSTWGPQWLGTQPKDPGVGGPVLDPRGITERPELGMGTRPHPGAYVILCRVRTPELQPSSMTPPLFNLVTQGPWEPSPWGLSGPHLSLSCPAHLQGAWDAFTTSHHPILGLPTTRRSCQGLLTPGHLPQALRAALGAEVQPEACCPAVQGSSGHQLWAPGSIWVEETM